MPRTSIPSLPPFQVTQLNTLINLLLGDLTKANRQRIMTICTIDVHARDVVAKMILQKIENAQAFLWLSQLRHRSLRRLSCICSILAYLHKLIALAFKMWFVIVKG